MLETGRLAECPMRLFGEQMLPLDLVNFGLLSNILCRLFLVWLAGQDWGQIVFTVAVRGLSSRAPVRQGNNVVSVPVIAGADFDAAAVTDTVEPLEYPDFHPVWDLGIRRSANPFRNAATGHLATDA